MQGFDELFTSYKGSDEDHIRGIYAITSYYHSPAKGNFNKSFNVKIGMSMALYHRMQNYSLYYPEGFYILGYVFLPLSADKNRVISLERAIHSEGVKYANEWFKVKSKNDLIKILTKGCKTFKDAIIHTDMTARVHLPAKYAPMALKDKKVIDKIAQGYENEAKAREMELNARSKVKFIPNELGPAQNTRYGSIKRK